MVFDNDALREIGFRARQASIELSKTSGHLRNLALLKIADALCDRKDEIIDANFIDIDVAKSNSLSDSMVDRLILNSERIDQISIDVRNVVNLNDPIGRMEDTKILSNGLQVARKRVPLGVIGAIFESRPNVIIDISVLCIKSGNSVILRGGSEAINTNSKIFQVLRDAVSELEIPIDALQFIESTDREIVTQLLLMKDYIDLLIPRGGGALIRRVSNEATMPVITGGIGVCHTYVDRSANLEMAENVVDNAKTHRPTVCNALDTIIVHSDVASDFLSSLAQLWESKKVKMLCDRRSLSLLEPLNLVDAKLAEDQDWDTEHLSLVAGVRIVDSLDEALDHILIHGSGHSEAIISEDYSATQRFLNEVDSSAVMVNTSTRFNDGAQLGLGAEIAISTDKLHARGPMGLSELTSYKWIVMGSGQIRK